MSTSSNSLGGRLSLLKPEALSHNQKKLYDQLQDTELRWAKQSGFQAEADGQEVIGPFNAMLRSPEIATALLSVTSSLTQHSALSEAVRQVVILTVGAVWQAAYELYAHVIVARKTGIDEAAIQALAAGQPAVNLSPEETLAHEFTRRLVSAHQVTPHLYQQAIETFGEKGVVDMIVLAGQYMTISALLNTFEVPEPKSEAPSRQINEPKSHPFWENVQTRTSRRGQFWISGERVIAGGNTFQRGPMFVAWEAPEHVIQPYPIVLVHGGLLQGTEWLDTPDGRPGWAQRLVEAGYVVFVVDRPGHGRSHTHPDIVGPIGAPFSYEDGRRVFFPKETSHTQWPFDPDDNHALDSFIAPFGPLPSDLATSQEMDAERLARLLDRIGPAIVMSHSASGPDGWLVVDKRPGKVIAIVTVEPMGPAFAEIHGVGKLDWGLTAARINYNPPRTTPEDVRTADPLSLRIPSMAGLPVAVVTGGASAFAKPAPAIVDFLNAAGALAEQLHLPDFGVNGNGHGLIYELNSDEALNPVLQWLDGQIKKRNNL